MHATLIEIINTSKQIVENAIISYKRPQTRTSQAIQIETNQW